MRTHCPRAPTPRRYPCARLAPLRARRPGRIDRKIEFPLPDVKTKRMIFKIHTGRMSLAEDVDLEEFIMAKDDLSGADIKAVCTEGGLLALRERRMKVTQDDFRKAKEKALYRKKGTDYGMYL
jgi:26S proteasome regulatory subunit T2